MCVLKLVAKGCKKDMLASLNSPRYALCSPTTTPGGLRSQIRHGRGKGGKTGKIFFPPSLLQLLVHPLLLNRGHIILVYYTSIPRRNPERGARVLAKKSRAPWSGVGGGAEEKKATHPTLSVSPAAKINFDGTLF